MADSLGTTSSVTRAGSSMPASGERFPAVTSRDIPISTRPLMTPDQQNAKNILQKSYDLLTPEAGMKEIKSAIENISDVNNIGAIKKSGKDSDGIKFDIIQTGMGILVRKGRYRDAIKLIDDNREFLAKQSKEKGPDILKLWVIRNIRLAITDKTTLEEAQKIIKDACSYFDEIEPFLSNNVGEDRQTLKMALVVDCASALAKNGNIKDALSVLNIYEAPISNAIGNPNEIRLQAVWDTINSDLDKGKTRKDIELWIRDPKMNITTIIENCGQKVDPLLDSIDKISKLMKISSTVQDHISEGSWEAAIKLVDEKTEDIKQANTAETPEAMKLDILRKAVYKLTHPLSGQDDTKKALDLIDKYSGVLSNFGHYDIDELKCKTIIAGAFFQAKFFHLEKAQALLDDADCIKCLKKGKYDVARLKTSTIFLCLNSLLAAGVKDKAKEILVLDTVKNHLSGQKINTTKLAACVDSNGDIFAGFPEVGSELIETPSVMTAAKAAKTERKDAWEFIEEAAAQSVTAPGTALKAMFGGENVIRVYWGAAPGKNSESMEIIAVANGTSSLGMEVNAESSGEALNKGNYSPQVAVIQQMLSSIGLLGPHSVGFVDEPTLIALSKFYTEHQREITEGSSDIVLSKGNLLFDKEKICDSNYQDNLLIYTKALEISSFAGEGAQRRDILDAAKILLQFAARNVKPGILNEAITPVTVSEVRKLFDSVAGKAFMAVEKKVNTAISLAVGQKAGAEAEKAQSAAQESAIAALTEQEKSAYKEFMDQKEPVINGLVLKGYSKEDAETIFSIAADVRNKDDKALPKALAIARSSIVTDPQSLSSALRIAYGSKDTYEPDPGKRETEISNAMQEINSLLFVSQKKGKEFSAAASNITIDAKFINALENACEGRTTMKAGFTQVLTASPMFRQGIDLKGKDPLSIAINYVLLTTNDASLKTALADFHEGKAELSRADLNKVVRILIQTDVNKDKFISAVGFAQATCKAREILSKGDPAVILWNDWTAASVLDEKLDGKSVNVSPTVKKTTYRRLSLEKAKDNKMVALKLTLVQGLGSKGLDPFEWGLFTLCSRLFATFSAGDLENLIKLYERNEYVPDFVPDLTPDDIDELNKLSAADKKTLGKVFGCIKNESVKDSKDKKIVFYDGDIELINSFIKAGKADKVLGKISKSLQKNPSKIQIGNLEDLQALLNELRTKGGHIYLDGEKLRSSSGELNGAALSGLKALSDIADHAARSSTVRENDRAGFLAQAIVNFEKTSAPPPDTDSMVNGVNETSVKILKLGLFRGDETALNDSTTAYNKLECLSVALEVLKGNTVKIEDRLLGDDKQKEAALLYLHSSCEKMDKDQITKECIVIRQALEKAVDAPKDEMTVANMITLQALLNAMNLEYRETPRNDGTEKALIALKSRMIEVESKKQDVTKFFYMPEVTMKFVEALKNRLPALFTADFDIINRTLLRSNVVLKDENGKTISDAKGLFDFIVKVLGKDGKWITLSKLMTDNEETRKAKVALSVVISFLPVDTDKTKTGAGAFNLAIGLLSNHAPFLSQALKLGILTGFQGAASGIAERFVAGEQEHGPADLDSVNSYVNSLKMQALKFVSTFGMSQADAAQNISDVVNMLWGSGQPEKEAVSGPEMTQHITSKTAETAIREFENTIAAYSDPKNTSFKTKIDEMVEKGRINEQFSFIFNDSKTQKTVIDALKEYLAYIKAQDDDNDQLFDPRHADEKIDSNLCSRNKLKESDVKLGAKILAYFVSDYEKISGAQSVPYQEMGSLTMGVNVNDLVRDDYIELVEGATGAGFPTEAEISSARKALNLIGDHASDGANAFWQYNKGIISHPLSWTGTDLIESAHLRYFVVTSILSSFMNSWGTAGEALLDLGKEELQTLDPATELLCSLRFRESLQKLKKDLSASAGMFGAFELDLFAAAGMPAPLAITWGWSAIQRDYYTMRNILRTFAGGKPTEGGFKSFYDMQRGEYIETFGMGSGGGMIARPLGAGIRLTNRILMSRAFFGMRISKGLAAWSSSTDISPYGLLKLWEGTAGRWALEDGSWLDSAIGRSILLRSVRMSTRGLSLGVTGSPFEDFTFLNNLRRYRKESVRAVADTLMQNNRDHYNGDYERARRDAKELLRTETGREITGKNAIDILWNNELTARTGEAQIINEYQNKGLRARLNDFSEFRARLSAHRTASKIDVPAEVQDSLIGTSETPGAAIKLVAGNLGRDVSAMQIPGRAPVESMALQPAEPVSGVGATVGAMGAVARPGIARFVRGGAVGAAMGASFDISRQLLYNENSFNWGEASVSTAAGAGTSYVFAEAEKLGIKAGESLAARTSSEALKNILPKAGGLTGLGFVGAGLNIGFMTYSEWQNFDSNNRYTAHRAIFNVGTSGISGATSAVVFGLIAGPGGLIATPIVSIPVGAVASGETNYILEYLFGQLGDAIWSDAEKQEAFKLMVQDKGKNAHDRVQEFKKIGLTYEMLEIRCKQLNELSPKIVKIAAEMGDKVAQAGSDDQESIDLITTLQVLLKNFGTYSGDIGGRFGQKTKAALAAFLGKPADKVTAQTFKTLAARIRMMESMEKDALLAFKADPDNRTLVDVRDAEYVTPRLSRERIRGYERYKKQKEGKYIAIHQAAVELSAGDRAYAKAKLDVPLASLRQYRKVCPEVEGILKNAGFLKKMPKSGSQDYNTLTDEKYSKILREALGDFLVSKGVKIKKGLMDGYDVHFINSEIAKLLLSETSSKKG